MLVLGGGVDGALGVARAADGGGHALGRDEGPVPAAVGGILQPHAVGEGGGLAAAHADLELQEGRARDLKVPALGVPGLLCGGDRGTGRRALLVRRRAFNVTLGFIRLQFTRRGDNGPYSRSSHAGYLLVLNTSRVKELNA